MSRSLIRQPGRAKAEEACAQWVCLVRDAFVQAFGQFESLLGDRWIAASAHIANVVPAAAALIEKTEAAADAAARSFIDGGSDAAPEQFLEALQRFTGAWQTGASALVGSRVSDHRMREGREDGESP